MKKLATIFALAVCALFASVSVNAQQPFGSGNIVVYRVGGVAGDPATGTSSTAGAAALSNAATPVFLDEYTKAGVFVRSISLPQTATTSGNRALTANGTSTSEGQLTRSTDGRFIILAGYNASVATPLASPVPSAVDVPRVIGVVNAAGSIDTTTALTDAASGNSPRGAASADGTNLYITGGAGGVRYATLGATTSTQLSTQVTNLRNVAIFGGQLYITTMSGTTATSVRLARVGDGLPTTAGQTLTNIPGFPFGNAVPNPGPYGFFFADLSTAANFVGGVDTVYVADDSQDMIFKFSYDGTNFVPTGSIAINNPRGLTGFVTFPPMGGTPTVTLITAFEITPAPVGTSTSTLASITDASGFNQPLTAAPTTLISAATNTAFRGVALAPISPTADTVTIEGRVTTAQGAPLSGVTIRLAGTEQSVTTTDADGRYSFEGVEVGGIYTVYASHRGYRFIQSAQTFGDVQTNTVADFVAAPIKRRSLRSRF